jgi:hypothetical protein
MCWRHGLQRRAARALTGSQRTLGAKAAASEREAARLRAERLQTLAACDQKELAWSTRPRAKRTSIIDQRDFSWTDLLSHFEQTLPPDVRITSVSSRRAARWCHRAEAATSTTGQVHRGAREDRHVPRRDRRATKS